MLRLVRFAANVSFVLVCLSLGAASLGSSFDDACQALPTGQVIVKARPVQVVDDIAKVDSLDMTLGTTGLESLGHSATVGTTTAVGAWELSYVLHRIKDPTSGHICYRRSLKVIVGYDPLQIAIAKPFKAGSCAYDAILSHELKHVQVYREFLPTAARSIQNILNGEDSLRYANSEAEAHDNLRAELQAHVTEVVTQALSKNTELNDRVDSPEETQRLMAACNGRIQTMVDHELDRHARMVRTGLLKVPALGAINQTSVP